MYLRYDGAWHTGTQSLPCAIPDGTVTGEIVHAEIRRVLAVLDGIPGASWDAIKANCVGPDLSADVSPCAVLQDRLTAETDRRRDVEAQLAKMTDAHAVVSQRLIGAQKEIGEVIAERDRLTSQHDDWQADIDRARSDVDAVHAVLDDAGCVPRLSVFGLPLTLFDRLVAVAQQRRRDDALRSEIAVAVGLDDSASLALILETVKSSRPAPGLNTLSGLLDVLAAPVAFGERRLSTVERTEWALRRWLTESKACDSRLAQLIEAEVLLDVLGVPAYAVVPSDDPGDASEALTLPERLRLHFGERS